MHGCQLVRMLAYYITWHMQQRLAPKLFTDDDPATGKAAQPGRPCPALAPGAGQGRGQNHPGRPASILAGTRPAPSHPEGTSG